MDCSFCGVAMEKTSQRNITLSNRNKNWTCAKTKFFSKYRKLQELVRQHKWNKIIPKLIFPNLPQIVRLAKTLKTRIYFIRLYLKKNKKLPKELDDHKIWNLKYYPIIPIIRVIKSGRINGWLGFHDG